MAGPRALDLALDLSRMPLLASAAASTEVPDDILELIRIAAGAPQACQMAEAATGVPARQLINAARFYLQHTLFGPDADSYRVLGLQPGASRKSARRHMRWLLQWLHPDHGSGLDGVYAERVLKAWREVSAADGAVVIGKLRQDNNQHLQLRSKSVKISPVRLAWIRTTPESPKSRKRPFHYMVLPAAMMLATGSAVAALVVVMTTAPAFG